MWSKLTDTNKCQLYLVLFALAPPFMPLCPCWGSISIEEGHISPLCLLPHPPSCLYYVVPKEHDSAVLVVQVLL